MSMGHRTIVIKLEAIKQHHAVRTNTDLDESVGYQRFVPLGDHRARTDRSRSDIDRRTTRRCTAKHHWHPDSCHSIISQGRRPLSVMLAQADPLNKWEKIGSSLGDRGFCPQHFLISAQSSTSRSYVIHFGHKNFRKSLTKFRASLGQSGSGFLV